MNDIFVMGLGAIGSNLLLQLSKVYPDITYHGIDYDKVEERNFRTQAYYREHRNAPKALAMSAIMGRHIQKPKYRPVNQKITAPFEVPDKSLILDCFDNPEARKIVKKFKCPDILHIGFSPEFTAEIIWDEDYSVPGPVSTDVDICTLNSAGPFIHFVVNFTAMQIINFMETDEKKNFIITGKYLIKRL